MPARERALIAIFRDAQRQYATARTDEERAHLRLDMQLHVTRFFSTGTVAEGWVGTVRASHTIPEGGAAWVAIDIAPDVTISTQTSQIADPDGVTLVRVKTPLYAVIDRLETGQKVSFDAQFFGGRVAADREMIMHPVIVAAFRSLKLIPEPVARSGAGR